MTATTIRVQMAQRKDTAANWTAANPILLSGEIGYETDTEKFKIGDGTTNWNSLAYLPIPDGSGNLTITGNLEIGTTGTLTFEGSTADGFETTLAVTDPTADRTITLPDVSGTVVTTGDTGSVTSTMIADGTIVNADVSATAEIAVSKLANGTANQVIVTDGTNVSWSDDLTLAGNLTVNGTTTTVNTETLTVKDKNIELAVVDTPTDVTADGGGITLKGTTDKTINWVDATDSWTSSEHVDLASGKSYRIDGTEVLSSTTLGSGVTGSSLTSVGTIATGVWQGTAIDATYLDSTIVTTGDTGTVTSTMIADGTIVDGDINASAAIGLSKLATGALPTGITVASANIVDGTIVDADISASAEIAVSKLADGAARQLLQTDAAGTGVEWTNNVDIPGTLDVTGAATFDSTIGASAGTASLPSITFTGDPNTGIYSPGADQLALSTNGTGRLFVDASGRVGIKTDAPTQLLHVYDGALQVQASTSNANTDISLIRAVAGPTGGSVFNIRAADGSSDNSNWAITTNANESLLFNVGGSERLRITSAGLVGIGTSSPTESLHIDGGNAIISGNLALGTTDLSTDLSYSRKLKISGTGPAVYLEETDASQSYSIGVLSGKLVVRDATAPATRITLTSAGNVGIGTNSPAAQLEVSQSTGSSIVQLLGLNGYNLLISNTQASGTLYDFNIGSSTGAFSFTTSAGERARIDDSGRLLVGTSSAITAVTYAAQIQSNSFYGYSSSLFSANSSGSNFFFLKSRNTTTGSHTVVQSGDVLGKINFAGSDGTKFVHGAVVEAIVDGTPGTDDMPGRLVFSVTADGAASPTEALRISSNRAITVSDGGHIVLGTGTGTKIGTSTSQKIGFFDETPIVQPTTGIAEAAFVENSGGTAVNVDSTFGGYTIQQVVQALQNLGLLA